jgi:aerobic carbon-monoxide dehydrogenase large subunit
MRFVGAKVQRVEDRRILTGRGRYIDDLQLPDMLHAAFLRSPIAHARIADLDVTGAREAAGVVAVYTGEDIKEMTKPFAGGFTVPGMSEPMFYSLATDKVRLVGDLVAIVIAESRCLAEDACELITVDYDPLPAITTYEAALDPASPRLFDDLEDNVVYKGGSTHGDVEGAFAEADRVVRATFCQHRLANVPMETRGAVAEYDPGSGEFTYHAATQSPHGLRHHVSNAIGQPMDRMRVLSGDVGGAFGLKGFVHREDVALAAASKRLGRPIKWIEDRSEHLLASGHAREETVEIEAAVKDDGTLLGIKAKLIMDQGAYPTFPFPAAMYIGLISMLLPGPYRVKGYSFESTVVATNKCCYVAYRGPWEMETWVRERLINVIADELDLDPADIRRQNMVPGDKDDRLITGLSLAELSSRESLERALELADYAGMRAEQAEARSHGRYLGIGFATFIEAAPGPVEMRVGGGAFGGEKAKVRLEADGRVVVTTQQAPHGQGHETTLAQIAADEMGVPFDHVRVLHGDTRITPFSLLGTGGSRAATWASGAVLYTTRALKDKVLAIASELLEISPEDLEINDAVISPRGMPGRSLPLAQIAQQVYLAPNTLPAGVDRSLEASEDYIGAGITGSGWSGGTHLSLVEVDMTTGAVKILRYIAVEDCGRVINPAIVEGQIRGGVAQGISEVLLEHSAYDDDGQCLAGSFMDYLLPTASDIPTIEIDHLETGQGGDVDFRGVGEAGAVVAPAVMTNAIADALSPFGVRVTEQYLPPSRILELAGVID